MFGIQTHKEISQDYLSDFNSLKVTLLVVWVETDTAIKQDYIRGSSSPHASLLLVKDTKTHTNTHTHRQKIDKGT